MTAGLPLVSSYINGIKDYTENEKTGYCVERFDIQGFKEGIEKLAKDNKMRIKIGKYNQEIVKKYDLKNIEKIMRRIYKK